MNLKKKILCGVLASSFVFCGLVSGAQTFAMVEEGAGTSTVAVDPAVNTPDRTGCTPLMRALREYNVEKVRELLAKGASLEIPEEYWYHYYNCFFCTTGQSDAYARNLDKMKGKEEHTNAFEEFCMQVLARYWDCNDDYDTYDGYIYRDSDRTAELGPKAREIAEIIFQHCVRNGIHLNVNPDLLDLWHHADGVRYTLVFDGGVREIFERYKREHGDLFTSTRGRELYYVDGSSIRKLSTEGDRLRIRRVNEELGLPYWLD